MEKIISYRELKREDENYFRIGTKLIKSAEGDQSVGDRQVELFASAPECCVFGAFIGEELIGIGLGGIIPKNQYEYYSSYSDSIFNILKSNKIGSLLFVAVKEEHRGVGVGLCPITGLFEIVRYGLGVALARAVGIQGLRKSDIRHASSVVVPA